MGAQEDLRTFNATSLLVLVGLAAWTKYGSIASSVFEGLHFFEDLDQYEIRDRLSLLVLILVVLIARLSMKHRVFAIFNAPIVVVMTASFIWWSMSSNLNDDDVAWAGLGPTVSTVCVLIAIILLMFQTRLVPNFSKLFSKKMLVSITGVGVIVLTYLPSVLQLDGGIIDLFHSSSVFNELLLPISGVTPLGDFATQYTSMLGWPLLAIKDLSAPNIMSAVLVWLLMLTVAQILAIAMIGKLIFRRVSFAVILLLSSSLILMKGAKSDEITGSIVAGFFSIPSRTFFPILVCLVLVLSLSAPTKRLLNQALLGALLPITAINNLEFGVPALLSAAVVLVLALRENILNKKEILIVCISAITSLTSVLAVYTFRSAPFSIELWTAMVRAQGSGGYMNVAMKAIDTYLFVFAMLAGCFLIGFNNFRRDRNLDALKAASTTIFASMWGVLSMPYYTGRSWPSHIQIFFIPLMLCIFGVAGILYHSNDLSFRKPALSGALRQLPLLMILVLPLGTFLIAPNPQVEWERALGGGSEWSFESQSNSKPVTSVEEAIVRYDLDVSRGVYFGDQYATTVQLLTGLRNGLGTNTVEYSLVSTELKELACRRLPDLNPDFVIAQNDDSRVNFLGPSLLDSSCLGMTVMYAPDDIGITIFSYKKPGG